MTQYRDCAVPYVRHFHTGYGIFIAIQRRMILCSIESKWDIAYPVYEKQNKTTKQNKTKQKQNKTKQKNPHARNCSISFLLTIRVRYTVIEQ